jgi:regulator of replication initiation timing
VYKNNIPDTPDFDKINAFVFDKFSHNNKAGDDKSTDIIPIIKKYVSADLFDRSGHNIKMLYNHLTINRPLQNDMSDKEYFSTKITPLLSSIYEDASLFTKNWGVSSDPFQRNKDETNQRCKMLLTDLMIVIEEDEKLQKEKEKVPDVVATATTPKKSPQKVVATAPKKKKPISATIKKLVWNTHIGEEIGKTKCLCCNVTDITQMSFNCGHIVAEANGGDTIVSNLKPICQNCNSSMGTKNMNDFMKSLK